MAPAHYIILHPESHRERLSINGGALVGGSLRDWTGNVWVDAPCGNEDPFVLCDAWIYSYCHATQLKRAPSASPYVSRGSHLFYCSGDAANEGLLRLDTVFLVDRVAAWPTDPLGLPSEFQGHQDNLTSELWTRHFKFAFLGHHEGRYTYVARMWSEGAVDYSFLPIDRDKGRVTLDFDELTDGLSSKIDANVVGKYPVMLSGSERDEILGLVRPRAAAHVVRVDTRRGVGFGTDAHRCC